MAAGGGGGGGEGGGIGADGYYFRALGGAAWQEESRVNGTNITDGNLELDTGLSVAGAFGYRWSNMRLEGFASYRQHDVDSFEAIQLVTINKNTNNAQTINNIDRFKTRVGGDTSTITGMVNGIIDIDFNLWVVPFVGVGLGAAHVSLNDVTGTIAGVPFDLTDDSDTVFAYQGIAGLAFKVTPQVIVETQYRYLTMTDPEFSDPLARNFDTENDSHNLEVGLRLNF